MRNRPLLFFWLSLAYAIMLVHSIVPHHHHHSIEEAANHHSNEHEHHHHDHSESHGHEHTSHLVHAEDFGNELISPKKIFGPVQFATFQSLLPDGFKFLDLDQRLPAIFPEEPPPDYNYFILAFSFRGPPLMIV